MTHMFSDRLRKYILCVLEHQKTRQGRVVAALMGVRGSAAWPLVSADESLVKHVKDDTGRHWTTLDDVTFSFADFAGCFGKNWKDSELVEHEHIHCVHFHLRVRFWILNPLYHKTRFFVNAVWSCVVQAFFMESRTSNVLFSQL